MEGGTVFLKNSFWVPSLLPFCDFASSLGGGNIAVFLYPPPFQGKGVAGRGKMLVDRSAVGVKRGKGFSDV